MKGAQKIGFFGECMIELQGKPLHSIQQSFSGDTCNTAVYFSRMTRKLSIESFYVTAVGTDVFSQAMLRVWSEEGIDCRFVQQIPDRHPGIYHILVDERGERSFSYWRNDSAARAYFSTPDCDTQLERLHSLDAFYLSGISLAILPDAGREKLFEFLQAFKGVGGHILFDNNYRPKLWPDPHRAREIYDRLLPLCDMALLTLDDEAALFGTATSGAVLERVAPFGVPEVVIKQGADACVISLDGACIEPVPATPVERVVDTTAAGDSFSAAYVAARAAGDDPSVAAGIAHRLAAQVIQKPGAIIAAQDMQDIAIDTARGLT